MHIIRSVIFSLTDLFGDLPKRGIEEVHLEDAFSWESVMLGEYFKSILNVRSVQEVGKCREEP